MILSSDLEAQKRDPEECEKKLEQTLTQEAEKQDQTLPVNLEIASSRKEYEERQERRMATMDDLDTKNTAEIAELTLELSQHQTQMEELTRVCQSWSFVSHPLTKRGRLRLRSLLYPSEHCSIRLAKKSSNSLVLGAGTTSGIIGPLRNLLVTFIRISTINHPSRTYVFSAPSTMFAKLETFL